MKLWILIALSLLTAGCGAALTEITTQSPSPEPTFIRPATTERPASSPTAAKLLPSPTPMATASPTPSTTLVDLGAFEQLLNNEADGSTAPLFSARAMGDETFTLESQRGTYVLLIPTVAGCGQCVYTLRELYQVYPSYQGKGVQVVVLNLYPKDVPESWGNFIKLYTDVDFIWSVINGSDFMIDYELKSLGTTLLIDPEGKVVFRRTFPLSSDEFQELFASVVPASPRP